MYLSFFFCWKYIDLSYSKTKITRHMNLQVNENMFENLKERMITLATKAGEKKKIETKVKSAQGFIYEAICTWPNTDKNIHLYVVVGDNGLTKLSIHLNYEPIANNSCSYDLRYYVDRDTRAFSGNITDSLGTLPDYGETDASLWEILMRIDRNLDTMEKRLLAR